MKQPRKKKFAAGLALGALSTAGLFMMLAASPATQNEAATPSRESEVPAAPAKPLSPASGEAEAVRAEVESLDAQIQEGLTLMGRSLKEFEAERRTWVSLDMTVAAARRVNLALLTRNRAVLSLYDDRLSGPIERFKERLKEAPGAYRKLAEERKRYAEQATLDTERKSYEHMEKLCRAAALLCEQRYREIFEGSDGQPNAATLAVTIANMRKYELVHARWEDTFARYPTSLEDRRMAALFAHLSVYAEDLEAFTQGVEALTEAMRRKAGGEETRTLPDATEEYRRKLREAPQRAESEEPASDSWVTELNLALSSSPKARSRRQTSTPPVRDDAMKKDILRSGALLDGSLTQGRYKMSCRILIQQRTGSEFTGLIYTQYSDGWVQANLRGSVRGSQVTMTSTRASGNYTFRSEFAAKVSGTTLSGSCDRGTNQAGTLSVSLVEDSEPASRVASRAPY